MVAEDVYLAPMLFRLEQHDISSIASEILVNGANITPARYRTVVRCGRYARYASVDVDSPNNDTFIKYRKIFTLIFHKKYALL